MPTMAGWAIKIAQDQAEGTDPEEMDSLMAELECSTDSDHRLSELPLWAESQRHQMLVEWNNTTEYPRDKCIHTLFEQQAKRTPDAIAVVFENQQLTYRELN